MSHKYLKYSWIVLSAVLLISCGEDDNPIVNGETNPVVVVTSPANGASGVAVDAAITATFSHNMDSSTITPATFQISHGVTGNVSYSNKVATFSPSADLLEDTTYAATITTGVKSAEGMPMLSNFVWVFTVGGGGGIGPAELMEYLAEAFNSQDTAAIGALLDQDFVGWGWDKYCLLAAMEEIFQECPTCSLSITVQDVSQSGDKARIISLWQYFVGPSHQDRVDTTWAIYRNSGWYLWGDRKLFSAYAFVVRFSGNNEYYVEMYVSDNLSQVISACVSGTGLSGCEQTSIMEGGECEGDRWWGPNVLLGSVTPPPLPAAYSFQVITADSTYYLTASVADGDYMAEYAEPIYPVETDTIDAGNEFTFTWHRIPGLDSIQYGIELEGHFWQKFNYEQLDDTTLVYDGPALTPGMHSYAISASPASSSAQSLKYASFYVR